MNLFSAQAAKKRRCSRSDSADFSRTDEKKKKALNDNRNNSSTQTSILNDDVTHELPVHAYKKEILHAIHKNPKNQVLLITAETGSGKSTQIPAYLLQHSSSHGAIAVTQPRRVAAMTLARRVAFEQSQRTKTPLSAVLGKQIGYRVRFDDCTTTCCHNNNIMTTQLVYVTDGMLLREAMMDPLLHRYRVIFLDEAHERSLQTDILMGVVQRARRHRQTSSITRPLQVIVMSATLQVETFQKFFGGINDDETRLIQIPGRAFPVQILYTEQSQADYLEAALSTILQIHEAHHESNNDQHGDGDNDILVFLPGQEEIEDLAALLKQQLLVYEKEANETAAATWTGDRVEVLNQQNTTTAQSSNLVIAGVLVCVLYAALPPEAQLAAFADKPATGCIRKIILATNIAETSVTLPGIRYVVDTGKHKCRHVSPATGMESLVVSNVSQAQAAQRAGRAGRVQAGICFRLYTEDAFEGLQETSVPEILRVNLAQVVLQLKGMGIKDPTTFEFVTPPDKASLVRATKLLYALSALDDEMQLTAYGKKLAKLPLDPVFGHLLLKSTEFSCVKEMLTAVSVLSAENLFYRPAGEGGIAAKAAAAHRRFASHEGDLPTFLSVYSAWQREAIYVPPASGGRKAQKRWRQQLQKQQKEGMGKQLLLHGEWCQRNFVSGRALARAYNVRMQLRNLCGRPIAQNGLGMDTNQSCGDDRERFLKCVAAGLFLQVASRIKVDSDEHNKNKGRSGLLVPTRGRYRTKIGNEEVSVHPTSTMFNRNPAPKCVVYTELVVTKKTYIRGVTQIREEWLQDVAPRFYRS